MKSPSRSVVNAWTQLGPRFMPFADAATADLPLGRLLRLSLFQVSVGMALALLVGTLNRVMIVELQVPSALVAVMVALPVLYAPFRALVGFRSDTHASALGWRRVPYIWMGTMLQFGGLAIMPFALLVLSGRGDAHAWPAWIGQAAAGLAFLLVGAGLHTTQTAGLALATDRAPQDRHPSVVGLMYVMLLAGTVVSALAFGALLVDFSPARLVQAIQAAALATLVLNAVALWKQEAIKIGGTAPAPRREPSFGDAWRLYARDPQAVPRLAAIGLGTAAFSMQDVLIEPYGGLVLGLSVSGTTMLTAALAGGGLVGFVLASRVLSGGFDPARLALRGAWVGVAAFTLVILAAVTLSVPLFVVGVLLIGFGAGLFGHGTLTVTMARAPRDQAGLALGVWGAVQATSAGVAVALGGIGRDVFAALASRGFFGSSLAGPATGYAAVYAIEIVLLLGTIVVMGAFVGTRRPSAAMADLPAGAK
jgi:BCD family chlorophyll transporter-like MFS transporter